RRHSTPLPHRPADHLGATVGLAKKHGPVVVAPVELHDWLATKQGLDEDKLRDPNKGGTVEIDGIRITLTDANHSSSTPDGTYAGEPCGLVFTLENDTTIYFAGDTNVFGDMQLIRRLYAPETALLPIGDN